MSPKTNRNFISSLDVHDHESTQEQQEDQSSGTSVNLHEDVAQAPQESDVSPVLPHCVDQNVSLDTLPHGQNTSLTDFQRLSTSSGSYVFHIFDDRFPLLQF